MGDGTKENPYIREDVLKLIVENISKTKGLNFSGKYFSDAIDLSELNLEDAIFENSIFSFTGKGKNRFNGSKLRSAVFRNTNLQYADFGITENKPTILENADFRKTILLNTNFQGADLSCAIFGKKDDLTFGPASLENTDFRNSTLFRSDFSGCYLYGTKFEGAFIRGANILEAHLEEVDWGRSFVIGEETKKDYYSAGYNYRRLKTWYNEKGIYDKAAKFYYREKEVSRKAAKHLNDKIAGWFSWAFFGYGEGWKRLLLWILGIIFLFSVIYFLIGTLNPNRFIDSLYFSAISFIAIGYGGWVKEASGFVRYLGVFETFIGFFMMTLLLTTFVRKWSR